MTNLENTGVENDTDPFNAQNAPAINLVVNMRIYDVLMAILQHLDADTCDRLYKAHAEGQIVGSLPFIDLQPDDSRDLQSEDESLAE